MCNDILNTTFYKAKSILSIFYKCQNDSHQEFSI